MGSKLPRVAKSRYDGSWLGASDQGWAERDRSAPVPRRRSVNDHERVIDSSVCPLAIFSTHLRQFPALTLEVGMGSGPLGVESLVGDRADRPRK
jgi:hypothetical protein